MPRQQETDMSTLADLIDRPPVLLRRALLADAAASGATALLVIAGAGLLEGLLGLPAALLFWAGIVLIPYVAFVAWAGMRNAISHPAVWAIIAANAAWAAASIGLLLSGWIAPNALGIAFVVAQAAVVALLGELQYMALRRPLASAA
jgi:hypothetical protein